METPVNYKRGLDPLSADQLSPDQRSPAIKINRALLQKDARRCWI